MFSLASKHFIIVAVHIISMAGRLICRVIRAFARWGLIPHPYGESYAKEHIGLFGGYDFSNASDSDEVGFYTLERGDGKSDYQTSEQGER